MTPAEERTARALRLNGEDLLKYFGRRLPPEDAADALGDLMVVAWRRVRELPEDPLEARLWLFGIARLVVSKARRSTQRRSRLAERLRAAVATSPTHADGADEFADVRDAIGRLPADDAELVRLVHWEGFTLVEAASVFGITPSAARSRYQRIRSALRAQLDPTREG